MLKIEALAYIVVEATDPAKWQAFAEQMLGMQALAAGDGLSLKMDERDFRVSIVRGDADRYLASGWQLADRAAFDATVAALRKAGVDVTDGAAELAAARRAAAIASFTDPAGNRHELVCGYTGGKTPFVSPIGVQGFKTGAQGMGHTVLPAIPFEPTLQLFHETLGMGLSDIFNFKPGPDAPNIRIYFLHAAAGRHHSLALAEMPNPAGCVHVMVEVNQLTDVGKAYDRLRAQGVKLMATLGEHENDRMTSFYMMTPGNFAIEYGYGGISVEPGVWQTTQTQQVSIWGHDFSVGFQ
ncbi:VOC family protein [Solimonas terrae]|uniref:Biphenyl 2,3-dioxygenase n=1 Tax=Solimonas terrae TaxID=1396819 RepID=A0A6M2BQC5_9GAMM|nr:VOC family protein [Solimonas terrae]NGY04822.1 biphenyl 2,3-dioxygenase [Solimonas terrae]